MSALSQPKPSSDERCIYLSAESQVFGPFTPEQLDELKASGEIQKYHWLWDSVAPQWIAANPPPTAPPTAPAQQGQIRPFSVAGQETEAMAPSDPGKPKAKPAKTKRGKDEILAVCHDRHSVVNGTLEAIETQGCTLRCATEAAVAARAFRRGGQVNVNILDVSSGRSQTVPARIKASSRDPEGGWLYQLEWNKCPDLF